MNSKNVAFVTGGVRGIGKAIVLELANSGMDVAINYRTKNSDMDHLIHELDDLKVDYLFVQGDVSNIEDCERMTNEILKKFHRIDVLVNNAGITKDNLLIRMKKEDFDSVLNINLGGTFNVTKQIVPIMMKQRSGKIINLASVVGIVGNSGQSNYAASKAGIIGFTKSLAKELASRNILVNAVAPGFIETDMTDVLSEQIKSNIFEQIPLKRMGSAVEVAKVVKFLSTSDSSYITGQVIHIDGGMVI